MRESNRRVHRATATDMRERLSEHAIALAVPKLHDRAPRLPWREARFCDRICRRGAAPSCGNGAAAISFTARRLTAAAPRSLMNMRAGDCRPTPRWSRHVRWRDRRAEPALSQATATLLRVTCGPTQMGCSRGIAWRRWGRIPNGICSRWLPPNPKVAVKGPVRAGAGGSQGAA